MRNQTKASRVQPQGQASANEISVWQKSVFGDVLMVNGMPKLDYHDEIYSSTGKLNQYSKLESGRIVLP